MTFVILVVVVRVNFESLVIQKSVILKVCMGGGGMFGLINRQLVELMFSNSDIFFSIQEDYT